MGKSFALTADSSETYNRVDKINMNNTKIVAPEKTGTRHFNMADQIPQPKSRVVDDRHIEEQSRHLGDVYVPKKGQSKVQGINQLQSSIGGVLKIEDNRRQGNFSDAGSVVSKKFDYRDRQGHDIFTFSNDTAS